MLRTLNSWKNLCKVPLQLLLLLLVGCGQSWLGTLPIRRGLAPLAATNDAQAEPGLVTEELLQALGRELWLAAEEMLEASAQLVNSDLVNSRELPPRALGAGGIALQTAADTVLDGDWESTMGELEGAAVSFGGYLPEAAFQGLVDLFSYEEPVPDCEWPAAQRSLKEISARLASSAGRVRGKASADAASSNPRVLAFEALTRASEGLLRATKLFAPSTFYMPPDPRATQGPRADWSEAEASSFPGWGPAPEPERTKPGSPEAKLVAEVLKEIEEASGQGLRRRSSVLRRLIRKLHPDQNPGREKEVLPAFNFVQRLRERG